MSQQFGETIQKYLSNTKMWEDLFLRSIRCLISMTAHTGTKLRFVG